MTRAAASRLPGRIRRLLSGRHWIPAVGLVVALSVTGSALAYWSATSSGTTTPTATMTPLLLTVTGGTPTGALHPGGQADVALIVSNPNPYPARVGALSLDTTQGTGGYGVDVGHGACGVSSLSFVAQSNNGAGWSVPPKVGGVDGALPVNLAGALSMAIGAADACQGATFTVYLVASPDYLTTTLVTSGLVSYWRLGADPDVTDTMTGTVGTNLQAHTGETGATWTPLAGSGSGTEVLTDVNRVRRNGNYAVYTASGAAAGADYAVQADVYVQSSVAGDMVGVIGRASTAAPAGTFYYARYEQADTRWHLGRYVDGVITNLATSASAVLTVGQTYRLRLNLAGSAVSFYVDEIQQATTVTDSAISAAGRGGILDGDFRPSGTTSANTNPTGLHLDNVRVVANTGGTVPDRFGGNPGTIGGAPLQGVPGAPVGDANTAMRFNGSTDYVSVPRQIQDDFSVEFWFRSTQGRSTGVTNPPHWWQGAGLVDAEYATSPPNDFGTSLRADGKVIAGVGGSPDTSIVSAGGYNDGNWHHVVMTRTRSTGAFRLYLDGALAGSLTGSTASLTAQTSLTFGRMATGGNGFAGTLDEVAVYNVALTGATVAAHYRVGNGS